MTDPMEIVVDGCWLALRLGKDVSPVPTGNLRVEDGLYFLGRGPNYFPLETVLVGVTATGDWRMDVATVLGVDQAWIAGFLSGFAQQPESSADPEFIQGFLSAEELRATRYRRHLPDRQ